MYLTGSILIDMRELPGVYHVPCSCCQLERLHVFAEDQPCLDIQHLCVYTRLDAGPIAAR